MPLKCIYCKSDATAERALEHVIPESFGNPAIVLPLVGLLGLQQLCRA